MKNQNEEDNDLFKDDDFKEIILMSDSQVRSSLEDKGYDTESFLNIIHAKKSGKLIDLKTNKTIESPITFDLEISLLKTSVEKSLFISKKNNFEKKESHNLIELPIEQKENPSDITPKNITELISFKASLKRTLFLGRRNVKKVVNQHKVMAAASITVTAIGVAVLQATLNHEQSEMYANDDSSVELQPLAKTTIKSTESNTPIVATKPTVTANGVAATVLQTALNHGQNETYISGGLLVERQTLPKNSIDLATSNTPQEKQKSIVDTSRVQRSTGDNHSEKIYETLNEKYKFTVASSPLTSPYNEEILYNTNSKEKDRLNNFRKSAYINNDNINEIKKQAISLIKEMSNGQKKIPPTEKNISTLKFIYSILKENTKNSYNEECYIENGIYNYEVKAGDSIVSVARKCGYHIKNYSKLNKLPILNQEDILHIYLKNKKDITAIKLYKKNELVNLN